MCQSVVFTLQLFVGPGDDESSVTFISDASGNPVEFTYPTNTRISFTVKVDEEEPKVTIFHWNSTIPQSSNYRVAGLEQ